MAKIFYSMAGEGRGHAARVGVVVDALRSRHDFKLFAPAEAFRMLAAKYAGTNVEVVEIPGILFQYTNSRRVDFLGTGRHGMSYLLGMPKLLRSLRAVMEREQPDLVITDFEPSLPRVARRLGVPFISLDHQHFLVVSDLSSLPWKLQLHAAYMARVVQAYYWGQALTITSSFYFPGILPRYQANTVQVGPLLRPEILQAKPSRDGHVVAYIRRFAPPSLLEALKGIDREVRLYGLGEQERDGNLVYRPISQAGFVHDLSTCDALVSTAGNQLVGEAFYLGKPVFAMPEARNYEQFINAHFVAESGAGEWHLMEDVTLDHLTSFLERVEPLAANIDRERMNGTPRVLEALDHILSSPAISAGSGSSAGVGGGSADEAGLENPSTESFTEYTTS